jgi:transposase
VRSKVPRVRILAISLERRCLGGLWHLCSGWRQAACRSRGGFTSKIHCLGDARGRPIAFDLTPGEAADCKSYDTLIELPERAPGALVADRAYDSDAIRDDLKQRGIRAVIPPRSNRTKTICYNKRLYRQRNCIERALGHLKINRAIATRYDQLADSFFPRVTGSNLSTRPSTTLADFRGRGIPKSLFL